MFSVGNYWGHFKAGDRLRGLQKISSLSRGFGNGKGSSLLLEKLIGYADNNSK